MSKGIGFIGVLQIVFIVLKIVEKLNWSWLWVLAPIWLPIASLLAVFLIYTIIGIVDKCKKKRKKDY